ncbi:hypothetical protein [Cupriavidus sp. RAF12]|uniref:hypothetical protein n=1 Tax=Cupriavidus sp. RAF12 TaxID=3233050 RepID=UPI003F8E0C76
MFSSARDPMVAGLITVKMGKTLRHPGKASPGQFRTRNMTTGFVSAERIDSDDSNTTLRHADVRGGDAHPVVGAATTRRPVHGLAAAILGLTPLREMRTLTFMCYLDIRTGSRSDVHLDVRSAARIAAIIRTIPRMVG